MDDCARLDLGQNSDMWAFSGHIPDMIRSDLQGPTFP